MPSSTAHLVKGYKKYVSFCRSMHLLLTVSLLCSTPAQWAVCHAQRSFWKTEQNPRPPRSILHPSTKLPAKVYSDTLFCVYSILHPISAIVLKCNFVDYMSFGVFGCNFQSSAINISATLQKKKIEI